MMFTGFYRSYRSYRTAFSNWMAGLQPREQRAITLLAVFCLMVGGYMGIWQPIQQARIEAQESYQQASADLQWMQQHVTQAKAMPVTTMDQRPLLTIVGELAARYQLTLTNAQPLDNGNSAFVTGTYIFLPPDPMAGCDAAGT